MWPLLATASHRQPPSGILGVYLLKHRPLSDSYDRLIILYTDCHKLHATNSVSRISAKTNSFWCQFVCNVSFFIRLPDNVTETCVPSSCNIRKLWPVGSKPNAKQSNTTTRIWNGAEASLTSKNQKGCRNSESIKVEQLYKWIKKKKANEKQALTKRSAKGIYTVISFLVIFSYQLSLKKS